MFVAFPMGNNNWVVVALRGPYIYINTYIIIYTLYIYVHIILHYPKNPDPSRKIVGFMVPIPSPCHRIGSGKSLSWDIPGCLGLQYITLYHISTRAQTYELGASLCSAPFWGGHRTLCWCPGEVCHEGAKIWDGWIQC